MKNSILSNLIRQFKNLPFKIFGGLRYASQLYEQEKVLFEIKKGIRHCGEGTVIEKNVHISWPSRLRIGDHCRIQSDCIIHSMGGIYIGNYVGIGSRSVLISFSHNYLLPNYLPYDDKIILKPIVIRDLVWIGFGVCIMPGIEIGEGAIVGLGSVVTRNIPPLAVVAGNPAEVIAYRNKKKFYQLKSEGKIAGHFTRSFFGGYRETIPRFIRKKYLKELEELGLLNAKRSTGKL